MSGESGADPCVEPTHVGTFERLGHGHWRQQVGGWVGGWVGGSVGRWVCG